MKITEHFSLTKNIFNDNILIHYHGGYRVLKWFDDDWAIINQLYLFYRKCMKNERAEVAFCFQDRFTVGLPYALGSSTEILKRSYYTKREVLPEFLKTPIINIDII